MDGVAARLATALREVREGWIPAHIFSDADIFARERARVFARTWQFLAHESELPRNGDFVVRRVLDDSFIVARGDDGTVRALLNVCRHRGMQVCRAEAGNAKRFTCPYHLWSYRNDGSLSNVPFHDEAYGGSAGLAKEKMSLVQAPRLELFKGLIFVNLDPQAASLADYLGDFAPYLGFYAEPAPEGIELRGPQRWRFRSNWKIPSENFGGDSYHTPHTHASVAEIGLLKEARASSRKGGAAYFTGNGAGATFKLGEGSFAERLASIGYPGPLIEGRAAQLPAPIQRMIGEEGFIPSAASLFPNLAMLHLWARTDAQGAVAPFTTFRLWHPVSVEETEVLSWFAVDRAAPEAFKEASYKAYLMCFGTSGMFEQDDMENWSLTTRMSRGQLSGQVRLHNRMGLAKDGTPLQAPLAGFPGPGVAHLGFNDYNQRGWMGTWARYMDKP